MILVLSGGTGGAKLIEGLAAEIDPAQLTIVCNTADDCQFHGLHISPDLDTITYTLAGMNDVAKGWGIKDDSFVVLEELRRLGNDAWFQLGDKDFATHLTRSRLLKEGQPLSAITERIAKSLGVKAAVLPMSDDRVETRIHTPQGELSFQEFFVKRHWAPEVLGVRFDGAQASRPAPGVIQAIERAKAIIICPSNPITSIGPILAVPGIQAALKKSAAPVLAVSPIVGTTAFSGPAHKLMIASGRPATAVGIAECYDEFLDTLMIANEDGALSEAIENMCIKVVRTDIRMPSLAEKMRLAREVLALLGK